MKILLCGANGYIGKRLLSILISMEHEVHCVVREPGRFETEEDIKDKFVIHQVNFLVKNQLQKLPLDIDAAYYLIDDRSSDAYNLSESERIILSNFSDYASKTTIKQIIYLGCIAKKKLIENRSSKNSIYYLLKNTNKPITIFRAGPIIGSGSLFFEIIRELVEKMPLMFAPKWFNSKCQPISTRDIIHFLTGVLFLEKTYNQIFDLVGPQTLTLKEMLSQFAKERAYKRYIYIFPSMLTRISYHWISFLIPTSFKITKEFIDNLSMESLGDNNPILELVPLDIHSYADSIKAALKKIEQNMVVSSWKDSMMSGVLNDNIVNFIQVPQFGCMRDERKLDFSRESQEVMNNIWRIGSKRGWYFANSLWKIRGLLDKIFGGVGLRRGRRDPLDLRVGDALDFWRVVLADKKTKRLLLYAEMKLPGEAWLEFKIIKTSEAHTLKQTATFRPRGVWGRIYWYTLLPIHSIIFKGMIRNIVNYKSTE